MVFADIILKITKPSTTLWATADKLHNNMDAAEYKHVIAVKRILRKHGYPPDIEAKATETVIEQAKLLANK